MADKRMLFIYNPRAGKAQIKSNLLDIIDVFVKAGYEVVAYPTQSAGDARRAVLERRPGFDMIACSGGDGTLDEVVSGMMESDEKLPIGYVPAGSTNDFATSLGIPKQMSKAAEVAVQGRDFFCDMGQFNGDFFVYTAAFGLFTDVTYETRQDLKNMLGHMAYLLEGMKRLPEIRSYHMKVDTPERSLEGDYLFGMVTNSISVGGFKGITGKEILLDDGLFEVTLIKRPANAIELNLIIAALVARNIDTSLMDSFKTSKLHFESSEPIAWTLDGEYGGTHTKVDVENRKQELIMRVPV